MSVRERAPLCLSLPLPLFAGLPVSLCAQRLSLLPLPYANPSLAIAASKSLSPSLRVGVLATAGRVLAHTGATRRCRAATMLTPYATPHTVCRLSWR